MKLHEGDYYLDEEGDYLKVGLDGTKAANYYLSVPFRMLLKSTPTTPLEDGKAKEYLIPKEFTQ